MGINQIINKKSDENPNELTPNMCISILNYNVVQSMNLQQPQKSKNHKRIGNIVPTQSTKQHISILQWNVRSLSENKLNELLSFMNNNSIDIVCLQETHLTKNQQTKSPGYTILRKDRSSERKVSGIAIIISNNIKVCGINFPDFLNDVAAIGIYVWLNSTKTYILSLYNTNGQTTDAMDLFSYITNCIMLKT